MGPPSAEQPGNTGDLVGRCFGEGGCLAIQSKLGEGGMGAVYLAWDSKHDRPVAIKFLHPERFVDREMVTRFKREGRKFARVKHPNLVKVYALGREQGLLYIASEYIEGQNLYEMVKTHGVTPPERALEICRDVAQGLGCAHEERVIHRDLKPENIMVRTEDGRVVVLDFGIAKDLDASMALTKIGSYIGTPAYSPPEQIKGEEVDHRADIFSLGVILYELLTGKQAFEGRKTDDIFRKTIHERPVPANRINDQVAKPVVELINRMIEKKPRKRFQSMNEVAERLDAVRSMLLSGCSEEERKGLRSMLRSVFGGPAN